MSYSLDKLYSNCNELTDAKDKIGEFSQKYQEIIDAAKLGKDPNVKKLASQLIGRYFKHFPSLQFQALEAVFDLCEDDDVNIRKQSIKDLPNLCKDNKENTPRIADILAQLLQSEDPQEQNITTHSLIAVITTDAPNALRGIFQQMDLGDDLVKERCFKFLSSKFKLLGKEVITKEAEDVVIEFCKKFMENATGEECQIILQLLAQTHLSKTVAGQREIVSLIEKRVDFEQPFDIHDSENYCLTMFALAASAALPYMSSQIDSNSFVRYFCEQILPQFEEIATLENGESVQITLLRHLAELSVFVTVHDKIEDIISNLYEKLLIYMPKPPENGDLETFPKQEFTFVECLLYAFHRLARFSPTFLTVDENRSKDFKLRLQYFARGLQGCIKKLNEKMAVDENLKKDKRTLEIHLMINNINLLIKDLFRSPPIYKTNVTLSWKQGETVTKKSISVTKTESNGSPAVSKQKRHTPITFENDSTPNKQSRMNSKSSNLDQQKIYTPPSGKYSNKVSGYDGNRRGRGSRPLRGNRGGFRGSNRGMRY